MEKKNPTFIKVNIMFNSHDSAYQLIEVLQYTTQCDSTTMLH